MTLREQFERALRVTLLVFVLAAACFLSAVTTIRIAIRGRVVAMPNLIGLSASAAQRALAGHGLQLRVADRVYSTLPVNSVVRQSPPPGEQVKIQQDAHVVSEPRTADGLDPASRGRFAARCPNCFAASRPAARRGHQYLLAFERT